jgi:uncharacterized protein (DUF983 family)
MSEVLDVSKAVRCTHHADIASAPHSKPSDNRVEAMARRTIAVWPSRFASYDQVMARGDIRTKLGPMMARALLRRCPRCGGAGWFTGWFSKGERCRTCGYRYERQPGFLVGALTVNTIVTFGLIAVVVLVGTILSYPDLALVPIVVAAVAVAVIVPIVLYPFSYTIWAAVDLAMRPLEPAEVADADAHRDQPIAN